MRSPLLLHALAIVLVMASLGCHGSPKKFTPGIDGAIIITKGSPLRYELADGNHMVSRSGDAIDSACAVRGNDLIGAIGDRTVIFQGLAFGVPIARWEEDARTGKWRLVGLSPEALWEGNEITTPAGSKIRLEKPGTYTVECLAGAPWEWKLAGFSATPYDWKSMESK